MLERGNVLYLQIVSQRNLFGTLNLQAALFISLLFFVGPGQVLGEYSPPTPMPTTTEYPEP